ncbi:MAG: tRNA (adenosine(37)-N6)-dimethylallyltransferase MiaA [Prolixibacteraceae bacterium]|nr:tRNA (adenosine(37)-N6)-dimethylallyltransferase MiaA [Prolixibacteraceae bacterium]
MTKNLILILGPTAIGKTRVSIQIAKHFNTEIISADSRQIYRELSIGTALPNAQQLHTVKHHLIHNHSIHEYYNAAHYEKEALEKIEHLFQKNDTVIMTGGSMLYIDVVCNGIDDLPDVDPEIRENLTKRFQNEGLENLRLELKKIDPAYYKTADLKNPKRILHALEIFYTTGKTYSSMLTRKKVNRDFNIVKIGLNTNRQFLHERINKRVDEMIENGLIKEARSVFPYCHLNSLNTVGYKELFLHFENKLTLNEAIERIKRNTRRYARRQITWFRKDKEITWFEPEEVKEIINNIETKLTGVSK